MRKFLFAFTIIGLAALGSQFARYGHDCCNNHQNHKRDNVTRVVSLAPSVTETICALGAQDKLVGVTRYCVYSAGTKKIAQVGGYIDPSLEAIVRLKPDLVIVTTDNSDIQNKLRKLGISVLVVDHSTIDGIVSSLSEIGREMDAVKKAEEIATDIRRRINNVRQSTRELEKPNVMIVIGRAVGEGVGEIYIAGKRNFYDEIIEIAGGINVYDSDTAKIPSISTEGAARLNPDVIIELAPDKKRSDVEKSLSEWNSHPQLSAVKNKRVRILTGNYVVIPGPRFINTLEDAAKAIHPEVDWSSK